MMKRHAICSGLLLFLGCFLAIPTFAATNNPAHSYPCSVQVAMAIADDLYATLDPKFQRVLDPHAISIASSAEPVMTPVPLGNGSYHGQISVSRGYIDLLNHIAHAKAIDAVEPGYFTQYVSQLAQAGDANNASVPPNLDDNRYWTDAIMNDQATLFNQMFSMTLAMNLSHFYLDHCSKYAPQISNAKLQPINNVLAPGEWEDTVKCATANSLDCALATQGVKTLFDCIDQMPHRPAWAAYVVPEKANIKKLNHELWRYEYNFFHGAPTAKPDRPVWGG